MKNYIDFNTEKRKNVANDLKKYFFKINDQFCLWKNNKKIRRINVKLVANAKTF